MGIRGQGIGAEEAASSVCFSHTWLELRMGASELRDACTSIVMGCSALRSLDLENIHDV